MTRVLKQVIKQAAANFSASLDVFYPAYGRNGFNERNLSYQLAKAFESRSGAHAFMEVPLKNLKTERFDNRIDCMLIDKKIVAFVECKRLYTPEKAKQLSADFERMSADNLFPLLTKPDCPRCTGRKVYRVMLTETWQKRTVEWWVARDSSRQWDHGWLPEDRGFVEVKAYEGGSTLYWLYAFELLEPPAPE